jgi:hydroxymethylpyrimidine/phosphomethylpyrimidine kinase
MRIALTIAGSDSGAGAGIQADLKTFAAHGVYGTSAITAVTAQNTIGVRAWHAVPVDLVIAQIDMVISDIGTDAVKIGMLGTADIARAVARAMADMKLPNVVVDPVMIAKGGAPLIDAEAADVVRTTLLPLADVVTPNIPEAEVLAQSRIQSLDDMRAAAQRILQYGPRVVVVKGGHLDGPESIDVACMGSGTFLLRGRRIESRSTHGTGCTLSSAIAANLANGLNEEAALREARVYLEGAILHAPQIGRGHGPLSHMWRWAN